MKKNLWVLLALSALITMFVIAGCAPKPAPTPTPTATATPTTPPADYCPTTWTTTIAKIYSDASNESCPTDNFEVYIRFDQPVTLLDLSTNGWSVKVARYIPYKHWVSGVYIDKVYDKTGAQSLGATVKSVSQSADGKTIILKAILAEKALGDASGGYFCGLVCNLTDYNNYIKAANMVGGTPPTYAASAGQKYADVVSWSYSGTAIYDENLNICSDLCGMSGSECCELPLCETCVSNCPIGSACD